MNREVGVGARVVTTAEQLDALPVGSTLRLRTACAAAVKAPDGRWTVTGMVMDREQVRDSLVGTLPHYVVDIPGEDHSQAPGRAIEYHDVTMLEARRFGSDQTVPIALEGKNICGRSRSHIDNGCVFLKLVAGRGHGVQVHLTTADALRFSDLLRALTSAEASL